MEPFKKEIMLALPKTNKMYQQIKDQNNFSNLCTLYVALTRAKKSIYMLSDTNKSSNNSLLNYIKDCLSVSDSKQSLSNDKISSLIWENGDKNWFKNNQIG